MVLYIGNMYSMDGIYGIYSINSGEVAVPMDILLSVSSGVPYYQQIFAQVKRLVVSGTLEAGEQLPSIRQLAKDLRVSVITTKRAYEELEQAGFITTVAGKGSFVGVPDTTLIQEEHRMRAEDLLRRAVEEARLGGVPPEDLAEVLQLFYRGDQ